MRLHFKEVLIDIDDFVAANVPGVLRYCSRDERGEAEAAGVDVELGQTEAELFQAEEQHVDLTEVIPRHHFTSFAKSRRVEFNAQLFHIAQRLRIMAHTLEERPLGSFDVHFQHIDNALKIKSLGPTSNYLMGI
jgi:hypothetical protein